MNPILETTPNGEYVWIYKAKDNIWKIAYRMIENGQWRKCDGLETSSTPAEAFPDHQNSKFRPLTDEEWFIFKL